MNEGNSSLTDLLEEIRACRACESFLPHGVRPVLQVSSDATILIVGQAPGTRVHQTGVPFNDPSGDRLRQWLGVDRDIFYDAARIAIVPMGFCFPGLDARGGDRPPRKECAPLWRQRVMEQLPHVGLTIAVGQYAQAWHLGKAACRNLTETVMAWRDYMPGLMPLPHPSWRNNAWLARNPWFDAEALPALRTAVQRQLRGSAR